MEPLEKQVVTLSHKVDALYQVIDQLSGKVSNALLECRLASTERRNGSPAIDGARGYSAMEHKDVLADSSLDTHRQSGEKKLTPEIQIQRLTVQLTAAYNRIAALEEQLLATRIH